ncbi:MAG: alanine racemase [Methylobacteriaceae bacterium]|nr:alanine racemase [Methylobacteriaceae bacterium]
MPNRLPRPPLNGAALDDLWLDATTKGMPAGPPTRLADIGARRLNLLAGDLPTPVAVLRLDRLLANSAWMSAFARDNGLALAPHGKTTMAPQLFALQMRDGAQAITVATTQQLAVLRRFGFPRAVLANQPTGRVAIDACFEALSQDDGFELVCLADSLEGVAALAAGAARSRAKRRLGVFVEIGFLGGRTGARDPALALEVARAVARAPGLALRGVEAFEGLLSDMAAIDRVLGTIVETARAGVAEGLFAADGPVTLSAGGSAFFDRVGEAFRAAEIGAPTQQLLRSGCYLSHDSINYAQSFARIRSQTSLNLPPGGLEAAIEVWAAVQSRPEPARSIVTMGKRDVSFDNGLPTPLAWRDADGPAIAQPMPGTAALVAMNDQHGHLVTTPDSPLAIGDLIGFGVGHPCTTFDKWRVLYVVDADYTVVDAAATFF